MPHMLGGSTQPALTGRESGKLAEKCRRAHHKTRPEWFSAEKGETIPYIASRARALQWSAQDFFRKNPRTEQCGRAAL